MTHDATDALARAVELLAAVVLGTRPVTGRVTVGQVLRRVLAR